MGSRLDGIELELQPDGSIVVRGVPVAELEIRRRRRPGRPNGPAITEADLRAACCELREYSQPIIGENVAAIVGQSRRKVGRAVVELFGDWAKLRAVSRTWPCDDRTHEADHDRPA
jgi:hypothetical protein